MSHLLYSVLLPLRSAQNKIHMYTVLAACLPRVAADVQCLPRVAADVQCNIAPRVALLTCSVATHNSRAMYRNCRHCSMQKYLKKQQNIKIFGYSIEEKKLLIISFANREQLSCTGIVLTRKFITPKKITAITI